MADVNQDANVIYDVLELLGAPASGRDVFVQHFPTREWRFYGYLGFGGKFWCYNDSWYVSCYQEDVTPERLRSIELANRILRNLYESRVS